MKPLIDSFNDLSYRGYATNRIMVLMSILAYTSPIFHKFLLIHKQNLIVRRSFAGFGAITRTFQQHDINKRDVVQPYKHSLKAGVQGMASSLGLICGRGTSKKVECSSLVMGADKLTYSTSMLERTLCRLWGKI